VVQPIDPDDSRPKYVQIAASVRAAILTGEYLAGSQLPTGDELAGSFGVTRATIQDAIRQLRDEGWVRSTPGSGVYVREQASLPGPEGKEHPLAGVATFVYEMGEMKHLHRSGWRSLGIPLPESVADHTFRVAAIGSVLAMLEGADPGRTSLLCLFHDTHETRIGDVQAVGRAYVTTAAPEAVTAHQTAGMPAAAAKGIQDLVAEYEANETPEARLAHDADKLDMLAQALLYEDQGYRTGAWQRNAKLALRTDIGQRLAQAISAGDTQWFEPFNASYAELRKSTRAHRDE
jgi:putative hydrolases of HD superfamily